MRATSKLLALILAAALQPAFADVVLKFNDITPGVNPDGSGSIAVGDRYLASDGVQFTGSALGVSSLLCVTDPDNEVGFGFIDAGGGCGGAVLLFTGGTTDPTFTINFAGGFTAGSSFLYSAIRGSGVSVEVFDALDGKGTGTAQSALTTDTCDLPGVTFCSWPELKLAFLGTAYSIVISGVNDSFMLDNLSLLAAGPTNPNPTPEPASAALALGALGALGWTRRRRAR
jgi:MYXO-CTERM domain-containing protein